VPGLALWGSNGIVGRKYDVLKLWRDRATQVSGGSPICFGIDIYPRRFPEQPVHLCHLTTPEVQQGWGLDGGTSNFSQQRSCGA
jgi:hypothetical protein